VIGDLATWQSVASNNALLQQASSIRPDRVADVAKLRQSGTADEVAVAIELVRARREAVTKFGEQADWLIADRQGVQQASSLAVARHKASRVLEAVGQGGRVLDACCGIGGDTIALAEACLSVTAVDIDPIRAWMALQNAQCDGEVADVADLALPCEPMHIDPARRDGSGRFKTIADYQPGPEVLRQLLNRHRDVAIKLSPAVDLEEVGDLLDGRDFELEFISEAGRLVQAVAWLGRFHRCSSRAATRIEQGQMHHLAGEPGQADIADAQRYIYTVDPAVERAGLIHMLGLPMPHPALGLVTSEQLETSPWLTAFELIATLPFRERKLKQWLNEHDAGIVEIKTRGKAVDPDRLQKSLRGQGEQPYTVFIHRWDRQVNAMICRRCSDESEPD
jgi:SAM-dependent methyltransferase